MQSEMLEEIRQDAIRLLDAAVAEVCEMMLAQECVVQLCCHTTFELIHAAVQFSGGMKGVCVVRADESATLQMASTMLREELNTLDAKVLDVLGEMANMISGAWKSRLTPEAAGCRMSVPVVTVSMDYSHGSDSTDSLKIERCYEIGSERLHVTIQIQPDLHNCPDLP